MTALFVVLARLLFLPIIEKTIEGIPYDLIQKVGDFFKIHFPQIFQRKILKIVEETFEKHIDEFSGLSQRAAIKLLEQLVKEEHPIEYHKMRSLFYAGGDFIKDEVEKYNFEGRSDKEALADLNKKYPGIMKRTRMSQK